MIDNNGIETWRAALNVMNPAQSVLGIEESENPGVIDDDCIEKMMV